MRVAHGPSRYLGRLSSERVTTTWRRPAGLAVLVAAAAIGLAACSGSASSPQVASLGTASADSGSGNSTGSGDGSGNSTAAAPAGNPAQLLDEWTSCMRSHGDAGQGTPTIDANKVIHVVIPPGVNGGVWGQNGQTGSGPGRFCTTYLNAASAGLNGGKPATQGPSLAQSLKYAKCMRANGIANFPDPGGAAANLGSMDPNGPAFQNAAKVCFEETGVQGPGTDSTQPGAVVEDIPGSGGSGPNG